MLKTVEDLYRFYVPLAPHVPRVALSAEDMQSLREHFSHKYQTAQPLQETDFVD